MNTASIPAWPVSFASQILGLIGRGAWRGIAIIARQPLTSVGMFVLTLGIVSAGANALYMQNAPHPAPLFMAPAMNTASTVVVPHAAPARAFAKLQAVPDPITIAIDNIPAQPNAQPAPKIGNADVAALQAKLQKMKLFEGKVDGYYGPQTASAIRAFELRSGMKPLGALSAQVLTAVRRAPIPTTALTIVTPAPVIPAAPLRSALVEAPKPLSIAPRPDAIAQLTQRVANNAVRTTPNILAAPPAIANKDLVMMVQKGLVRLGFLRAEINGVFDEATARAVREFENYNNYRVTGKASPDLVDMLMSAGALN